MSKYILSILIFLSVNHYTFADNIKFTASAKSVVTTNQQFRLTFQLNAKGSGFKAPDLSDFDILIGPSTSSSSSIQFVNGQMSQSYTNTYTYVLQAQKTGKFKIGPASVKVNGKTYTSNPITIEVVKGSSQIQTSGEKQNNEKVSTEDLFVRVHVSRTNLLKGEHLVATIKVYTKVNLAGFEDMSFPSYSGFWKEDIPTSSQIQLVNENINGEIYGVGVISQVVLYPQKTGELYIEPFELECVIRKRVRSSGHGFFNSFFDSYKNYKVKVKSPKVKINVKPLPPNAPEGFNGAVGTYQLETSIDKAEVKANDPITYKLKIKGQGNIKLIDPPEINFPADFEVYDPNTSENIKNNVAGSSGSKTMDYLIIPRHAGNFIISPVKFTYFDINTKQYKTITSPEYNIKVTKGDNSQNTTMVSNFSKEDIQYIGKDIRFIKTGKQKLRKINYFLFGSTKFILSYIIAFVLFIIIIILKRKQIKQRANAALIKNKKAKSAAKKRLKLAAKYLKDNNKEMFYDEITKALWGYLSDKLNIPPAELTKDNVHTALKNRSIDDELIEKFTEQLNICEYARYAPAEDTSQKETVFKNTADIISELEQNIK